MLSLILSAATLLPSDEARILLIGDSHTYQTFGRHLDASLRTVPGVRVRTVGICGARAQTFLEATPTDICQRFIGPDGRSVHGRQLATPGLDALLAEFRPTVVLVALGANSVHLLAKNPSHEAATYRRLVNRVRGSGAELFWVGPPDGKNKPPGRLSALYRMLADVTGGPVFDSRRTELPYLDYARFDAGGDGIHFDAFGPAGKAAARRWADAVLDWWRASRAPV